MPSIADTTKIRFHTMPDELPPEWWHTLYRTYLAHYLTATGTLRIYAGAVLAELIAMDRARREAKATS